MKISFDVISDLNLTDSDQFEWVGKPTSQYCIIAGNISNNLSVIKNTLLHLSKLYQAIFYISGTLEHDTLYKVRYRHAELTRICRSINNVSYLYNFVIVVDGVAIIGINGWSTGREKELVDDVLKDKFRNYDFEYLQMSIERLQLHGDVKKIVVVSNSVPNHELYFGEHSPDIEEYVPMSAVLGIDSEQKVSHWIYGHYPKTADVIKHGVNYINNSCYNKTPYWPKYFEVTI